MGSIHRPTALRPFWSGVLTFGLVAVPVELFATIRSSRASLRMVGPDGLPLERRFVCPAHHRAVDADELVRGAEVGEGEFVTVTDDELEALEPTKTREIDLQRFVPRSAIDPVWTARTYLLLPDGEVTKAYRLLARTLEDLDLVGMATFVMRAREHQVAVIAEGGLLRAETLHRFDALRSAHDVGLGPLAKVPASRVKAFESAIAALAEDELPMDALADQASDALRELAATKSGAEVVRAPHDDVDEDEEDTEPGRPRGKVVDLMAVLKERLGVSAGG